MYKGTRPQHLRAGVDWIAKILIISGDVSLADL